MLQRRQQGQDLYADVECKCVSDSERAVNRTTKLMCSAPGFGRGLFLSGAHAEYLRASTGRTAPQNEKKHYRDDQADLYLNYFLLY